MSSTTLFPTVSPGSLPSASVSDESSAPNFFIASIIVSVGLSCVLFVICAILFIVRQIIQCTVENRNMKTLRAHKKGENSDLTDEARQILKQKDKRLQTCMDVLFIFENGFFMLTMLVVITILAEAVAFNLMHWGYAIGFGLGIIIATSIHTFRVRRVERQKALKEAIDVTAIDNPLEEGDATPAPLETPITDQEMQNTQEQPELLSPMNEQELQAVQHIKQESLEIKPEIPSSPVVHSTPFTDEEIIHKEERFQFCHVVLMPLEIYVRALQFGIMRGYRFPLFLIYFLITMLVAFVLTSAFYGTCICTEPYDFTTTFSRYTNGAACASGKLCTVVAMLPEEPSTQMIIKFYSQDIPVNAYLTYSKTVKQPALLDKNATTVHCSYFDLNSQIAELESRYVYTCDMTGLTPSTQYYFTIGIQNWQYTTNQTIIQSKNATTGWYLGYVTASGPSSRPFSFVTMHNTTADVFFVTGGDQGAYTLVSDLMKQAVALDPQFIAIGGDMNYDNGLVACYRRVLNGLNIYAENAFSPTTGAMIPLLTAIGNHEAIWYKFASDRAGIQQYLAYYSHQVNTTPNNRTTYHAHTLGKSVSLLVLDSYVYESHSSQVPFIQNMWTTSHAGRIKLAMYHAPLFPSSRPLSTAVSVVGQQVWEPVFSSLNMTMGFENHDHTLKRTHVIRDGIIRNATDRGVVYVGDGNMGVTARHADLTRPFIAYGSDASHFWMVRCNSVTGVNATAVGQGGVTLHNIIRPPQ